MNTIESDQDLKNVAVQVCVAMDTMDCTTDGIIVHVNHWGRWVAKFKTHQGKVFVGYGINLQEAMENLLMESSKMGN